MPFASTKILGVVNITADSFSDGGLCFEPAAAIAHAQRLMADGADAVDLGAASTHPDAEHVGVEEEIRRLEPVVTHLTQNGVPLSIDSYHPEVQRWAIKRGAAFLNDIHGFPHAEMYGTLATAKCDLVLMHSIQRAGHATRVDTNSEAVLEGIFDFFAHRVAALVDAGVAQERVILDPGMGFFLGSSPAVSLLVLRNLTRLRETFGCRVLVSVSRKSFLGAITGRAIHERGPATLAAELFAAQAGVAWIRTHDVRALRDGLAVAAALGTMAPVSA